MELQHSKTWKEEVCILFKLCLPSSLSALLAYLMQVVSLIFLGHLGITSLAAATMGNTLWNLVWYTIQGMSTAQDTLASQAYGANDLDLVKLWSIRMAIVLSISFIPFLIFLLISKSIFITIFNLSQDISNLASDFCLYMIPGTWFLILFLCAQKYQQAQNIMMPSMIVGAIANILNIVLNYVFIYTLEMGFIGSPIAASISRLIMLLMLLSHVFFTYSPSTTPKLIIPQTQKQLPNNHHVTNDPSRKIFHLKSFKKMLTLCISGGIMMAIEVFLFEGSTLMASQLGSISLDAHNILLSICWFSYLTIPFGISVAATIRVGNLIGANDPVGAKKTATYVIGAAAPLMALSGILIACFRWYLGYCMSSNMNVILLVGRLAPLAAYFQIFDGIQGVCQGVWRGIGRQAMIAKMNLFAFWFCGLVTAVLLCFVADRGVFGIWIGFSVGLTVNSCLYIFFWFRIDWKKEADNAAKKLTIAQALVNSYGSM